MKWIRGFFALLTAWLIVPFAPVSAAGEDEIYFSAAQVEEGQTNWQVTISAAGSQKVNSGKITVTYDSRLLTLVRDEAGDLLYDASPVLDDPLAGDQEEGTVVLTFSSSTKIDPKGTLLLLEFDLSEEAQANDRITFEVEAEDWKNGKSAVSVQTKNYEATIERSEDSTDEDSTDDSEESDAQSDTDSDTEQSTDSDADSAEESSDAEEDSVDLSVLDPAGNFDSSTAHRSRALAWTIVGLLGLAICFGIWLVVYRNRKKNSDGDDPVIEEDEIIDPDDEDYGDEPESENQEPESSAAPKQSEEDVPLLPEVMKDFEPLEKAKQKSRDEGDEEEKVEAPDVTEDPDGKENS